jgi:bacteriorhodopsin
VVSALIFSEKRQNQKLLLMLAEDLPTSSEDNEYRLDCGTPSGLWGVSVNEVAPRTFNSASPPRERASNLAGLQSRRLYSGVQDEEASTEDTSTGGVLTGQYVSLAEDTSSRETAILSPDGKVAVHKNVLPELCAPSCAAAIVVYIGTLLLVGAPLWPSTSLDDGDSWLHDIKSYPEPDPAFARMCLLCAVAFMAAAVHNATALIFLRRGAAQRSVSHCAVCINVTAAHAHWMMGAGHSPTFNSCFGRTMHATRFAEWLSTLFLMMVLTNALDCSSRRDLIRSSCMQVASVALGFAASATCQLTGDFSSCLSGSSLYLSRSNDTHTNNFETCCGTAVHWQHRGVSGPEDKAWWLPSAMMHASKAHQLNLLLLLGSCWCFAGWPLEVLHEWRERFSAQRAGAEVGLAHATQAAVLRAFAAAAWTLFPALYFLGAFDPAWFPPNIEIYAYSAVDLLTKFMYANVLCDANLLNLWAEDRARAQIARKESANEAHRHFLR